MNKEMLQALKFYHQRFQELSSTVPEAQGCNPTPVPNPDMRVHTPGKKKEKDMYNTLQVNPSIRIEPTQAFSAIETAQDHLIERLSDATEAKIQAAKAAKGLINDDRPRTAQSFVDRILAGKFVIPEDRKNQTSYDPTDYITWRDPSIKKDEAGFEAIATAVNAASDEVMDTIIVNGNEAGLAAIKAFKAKTFN